jgi:hypothetical protein
MALFLCDDVLQRIDTHPAKDVRLLTPRLWKEHFANNPLRAPLDALRRWPISSTASIHPSITA